MRFSLHATAISQTLISPITGDKIEFQVRAYCPGCGCLVSHSSIEKVEKRLSEFEKCKKCGCLQVEVKYTAYETVMNYDATSNTK